ncbi:MAG: DUF3302 domain-containing protein [Planctomycetes bacterium]|nr:DUF3302 domain-containing protein [Planctomycetota bacterium]
MIDVFDIIAFIVFGALITAVVVIVVFMGSLPGKLARQWGHPQAAAINVASWLGIATLGFLWPLALIWAFLTPRSAAPIGAGSSHEPPSSPGLDANAQLVRLQAQVNSMEAALQRLAGTKGVQS